MASLCGIQCIPAHDGVFMLLEETRGHHWKVGEDRKRKISQLFYSLADSFLEEVAS